MTDRDGHEVRSPDRAEFAAYVLALQIAWNYSRARCPVTLPRVGPRPPPVRVLYVPAAPEPHGDPR